MEKSNLPVRPKRRFDTARMMLPTAVAPCGTTTVSPTFTSSVTVNWTVFFGLASELIRRILVDYARNRLAAKRGGANVKLSLDEAMAAPEDQNLDLVAWMTR